MARISNEKLLALKARLRRGASSGGKFAAQGAKGSAISLAVGAAAYVGAVKASEHISFLRSQWYMTPAVLAVAGHFLKRKNHDMGIAALGAAGMMLAQGFMANQSMKPASASGYTSNGNYAGAGDYADAGILVESAWSQLPALRSTSATSQTFATGDEASGDAGMLVTEAMGLES